MLGTLEAKLAAVVSDGVASRPHLDVGIAPPDPPSAGKGRVAVALSSFAPEAGFVPHMMGALGSPGQPQSRRILPLRFEVGIDFQLRPAQAGAAARAAARALLLEDMSAVAYLLAEPRVQNGAELAGDGDDPGYRVLSFALASAAAPAELVADCCTGRLVMRGDAHVWPIGAAQPEGVIGTIDRVIAPLPLALRVAHAQVRPGAMTMVTVAPGSLTRLVDPNGDRGPLNLALTMLADVPLAARGTIPAGDDGVETGVRILPVTPDMALPYQAPAGDPGANGRIEYLAVHLATPDGHKGLYLGSAPIRLAPAP